VIFERDDIHDQIAQVGVGTPEKRLGAASAILKCEPDHRRTNNLPKSGGNLFGSFLVSDREAERRGDH
jgi:hypothetical protein